MKRYYIIKEFFGIRVYDAEKKIETYFNNSDEEKIRNELNDNYIEICNTSHQLSTPLKISMNITKKCNLRCEQCFSDSGVENINELTTEEIKKLFDDMAKYGTFFICIGGGEPLMRDDLLEILRYGKQKRLAISLVSNGLLLDQSLVQHLNEMDLDTFWISFDGLELSHERLRGKGTYRKALCALQLLQEHFTSKKAIRVSLNKYNISEYKNLIKLAEDYGIDIIRFTPLISFGRAIGKNFTISQEQYIEFLNDVSKIKSNVKIIYPNIVNDSKFWVDSNDFGCHCGKEAIWIDECGNYSPCIFLGDEFWIGNIKTDSWQDLWKKSLNSVSICGNDICKNCNNYRHCRGGCRARAYNLTHDINAVDPLCPLRKNKEQTMKTC